MPENETEEGSIGTLDGCALDFTVQSDEETEAMLIPKGKENPSWSEEEEEVKSDGT
jgi:hypothetical protein